MSNDGPTANEILWRQYSTHIELYKFYLEITLKAVVFYYAITGAIVSYYFAHESDGRVKFALLLPIAMSVVLAGLFVYGAGLMKVIRDEVFSIAQKLQLETGIEVRVLMVALWAYAGVLSVTAGALAVFFWAQF